MMKRLLVTTSLLIAAIWSVGAMAETIGVVNMRQVFESSAQVKKINDQLSKQYSPQRDKIVSLGKELQENINKIQKNQAVMDKKSADQLRETISKQEQDLRMQQAQFQQTLFTAQNKAMNDFMDKVTAAVKKVADEKKIEVVLPQSGLLYAKDSKDITSDVLSALK
jgi:outer membrane protein